MVIYYSQRACSSVGRAFGSHPRGRGFESLQVHHCVCRLHISFAACKLFYIFIRRCDGIGRRAGLKIRLPLSRADARNPLFYKGFQNLKNPIFGLCPPKCPPISGKRSGQPQKTIEYAGVMELADVLDSKSSPGDRVRVRPPPPAPSEQPKPLIFQGVSVFFTPAVSLVRFLPISHENVLGGHTIEFLRARKAFADAVSGDFGGHLRGHQNPFVYSNKPKIAFADSTFDE